MHDAHDTRDAHDALATPASATIIPPHQSSWLRWSLGSATGRRLIARAPSPCAELDLEVAYLAGWIAGTSFTMGAANELATEAVQQALAARGVVVTKQGNIDADIGNIDIGAGNDIDIDNDTGNAGNTGNGKGG